MIKPILSILICSVTERAEKYLAPLIAELDRQIAPFNNQVEVISIIDRYDTSMKVGTKRNLLREMATGIHQLFLDDDDWISEKFISEIMKAIKDHPNKDVYCYMVEYSDQIYHYHTPVHYSVKYRMYTSKQRNPKGGDMYRSPNHLMVFKSVLANRFPFPEWDNGEDTDFEQRIAQEIKSEYQIPKILYYYRYRREVSLAQRGRFGS